MKRRENAFHVYKGNYIYKRQSKEKSTNPVTKIYSRQNTSKKVVVFDLDETIGSFSDLYDIWTNIYNIDVNNTIEDLSLIHKQVFFCLLDLFPEFLRPGIFTIFESVIERIKLGQCHKIFIYTNNQCEAKYWVSLIILYLDHKLGVSIGSPSWFSPPVCAFKIGNRIIEPRRTTHNKTYNDLVKCITLPSNIEICFLDNTLHSEMRHKKVFYIHPPSYLHEMSKKEILDRFKTSEIAKVLFPSDKIMNPASLMTLPILNEKTQKHIEVYYKILFFLEEFFSMVLSSQSQPKTRKAGKSYFETETKSFDATSFYNVFVKKEVVNAGRNSLMPSFTKQFMRISNTRKNKYYTGIEKIMDKYKYTGK